MPTWLAVTVLVAAVGLTYLCCIRPMRRGTCSASSDAGATEQASRREEIDQLRAEISQARRDLHAKPFRQQST
jgi:hypothetical protein